MVLTYLNFKIKDIKNFKFNFTQIDALGNCCTEFDWKTNYSKLGLFAGVK